MELWHTCPTHGQTEHAWGCPECVRELRHQVSFLMAREARLKALLQAALRSRREWIRSWIEAREDTEDVAHVYSSYFRTEPEGNVSVRLYVERREGVTSKVRIRELVRMGMPEEELEEVRKAFERWMSDKGKSPKAVERNKDGVYRFAQTASNWTVWQARGAASFRGEDSDG